MQVKAFIFDLDGTLIDSMEEVFVILNSIMRELGLPEIHEKRMNEIAGRRVSEILRSLAPHLPSSTLKKSESKLWNLYSNCHFHLLPGVGETLSWLRKKRIFLAVLTTTPREVARKLTRQLGISEYFRVIVANEDVELPKPDPEGVIRIAETLDVKPEECVVVGDSPNDIKAGKAAGSTTIGVLTGYSSKEKFEHVHADFVLRSIRDIPEVIGIEHS